MANQYRAFLRGFARFRRFSSQSQQEFYQNSNRRYRTMCYAIPTTIIGATVGVSTAFCAETDVYYDSHPIPKRLERFSKFASVEYNGVVYMTPQDLLDSLVLDEPRERVFRNVLEKRDVERMLRLTPALKKGTKDMFRSLGHNGIISYAEYLFLLTLLTKSHSSFKVAFSIFDDDGNEKIDKEEFLKWEVASRAHMRELSTSRGDVQSIGSSQLDALSNTTMSRSHPAPGQPSGLNSAAYAAASSGGGAPPPFCCECAATQNRCSTDMCPCFASRRMCDEHCESARYRGDCLNQAICKCACEVDPAKPAKNACTKSERCDCLRIKEGCSKLCACKQICKNKEPPKKVLKVNKPTTGCQCAKSKKQCVKKECPCRLMYEFCSSSCKCTGDCTNGPAKFHVPKHVQSCFLEHKNESSGLIVTLIGNDYIYRGDFYHESKNEPHVEEQLVAAIYDLISKYKVELYEIIIFVSKSPCFHQDCDPKCEVVDECKSNKACAKLLGLLLSKVRKELSKVDVRMSVKFLYPHLNRGDLYTKQGILSMLQAGIKVEPLLMKDWSAVMDWSPNADHKGEYLQLWNSHNLDKCNAQSQSFINECRRALGLSMKFWVAEIHEIVKNTILHYSEIRSKCNELNDALKQLDLTATPHKIRSTPSKRRSFTGMLELKDKLLHRGQSDKNKNGSNVSVASEEAHAQAMVASFCGRSFDDGETNEIAQRIRRATANINVEIEALLEFLTHKGAIG